MPKLTRIDTIRPLLLSAYTKGTASAQTTITYNNPTTTYSSSQVMYGLPPAKTEIGPKLSIIYQP